MKDLATSAQALEKQMKAMSILDDVNSDLQLDNLQVNVNVDRDKCSQLGITMAQVEDALDSAYSARQISTIYGATNEFWVIIEVEPAFLSQPSCA